MRRAAAAVLAALAFGSVLFADADAYHGGWSGLQGTVWRGPTRPVCEEGMRCDAPAPGVTLVFSHSDHVTQRVTSGFRGKYFTYLPPGVYAVRTPRKLGLGGFGPRVVRVPAGRVARADFFIDTGIR